MRPLRLETWEVSASGETIGLGLSVSCGTTECVYDYMNVVSLSR